MKELLHWDRLDLHYVANIQIVNPLVLVQEPKDATHVWLVLLEVIIVLNGLFWGVFMRLAIFSWLLLFLNTLLVSRLRDFRVNNSPSDLPYNGEHLKGTPLNQTDWLLEEILGDFSGGWRVHDHWDQLDTLCIFKIALLLRCLQVVPIIYLVDVDLTKLLHVFEHLMWKPDAFARILKGLWMVLILTKNGAQLQFQLALLIYPPVPLRDSLVLVEFSFAHQRDPLFQVENALVQHAESVRNEVS
jgi:hypothetical protein